MNKCLNEYLKSRDQVKGFSNELKIFFNDILIGCPIVFLLCKVSKYPIDLKEELNALALFSKRVIKEENVDNSKVRSIINDLDGIKRENTLLN